MLLSLVRRLYFPQGFGYPLVLPQFARIIGHRIPRPCTDLEWGLLLGWALWPNESLDFTFFIPFPGAFGPWVFFANNPPYIEILLEQMLIVSSTPFLGQQ